MSGRLIAVVGPSGVGKDTLIGALCAVRPALHQVRRAITRPADVTEPFQSVDDAAFDRLRDAGAFALHWSAHGLRYGIPMDALTRARAGEDVVANLSRGMLDEAAQVFPALLVLSVTATPEVLAKRLGARGRESTEDIARRLSRVAPAMPAGVPTAVIRNDGTLESSVAAALAALDAQVSA